MQTSKSSVDFQKILEMNESRKRQAIRFKQGNMQIIAPAGASKTDIIAQRIKCLREEGMSEGIAAFTFNENAAEELAFRTKSLMAKLPKNLRIGDLFIGTQHKFCMDVLKEYAPKYVDYSILEDSKRFALMLKKATYNRLKLYDLPRLEFKNLYYKKQHQNQRRVQIIKTFLESSDIFRDEDLPLDRLDSTPEFRHSFSEYERLLDDVRVLDFSSMTYRAVKLLRENPEIKDKLLEKYKFLIVDEYQDINPIQESLIRILSKNKNVFVVGDDDQCINQFRGTDFRNILTFKDRYEDVKLLNLRVNYRSTEGIVNMANSLIRNNSVRLDKEMNHNGLSPNLYQEKDITFKSFQDEEEEINFIAEDIKNKLGMAFINSKGEKFKISSRDVGILTRVNSSAQRISEILRSEGINIVCSSPGLLVDSPEIMLVIDCILYLHSIVPGLGGYVDDEKLIKMYLDIAELDDKSEICLTVESLSNRIFEIFGSRNPDEIMADLTNLKAEIERMRGLRLQDAYHRILNVFLKGSSGFRLQQNYNFGKFSQLISSFEEMNPIFSKDFIFNFIEYIWGYIINNAEEGGFDDIVDVDAVKIMTIHKAKGLEFPIVYLPHFVNDIMPCKNIPKQYYLDAEKIDLSRYDNKIEDERRLAYVAITRSQKYLTITASERLRRWPKKKAKLSKFYEEIDGPYIFPETHRGIEGSSLETRQARRYFKTSHSTIRYYEECPFSYLLRFKYGYNPGVPIVFGFGTQIHKIINILHKEYVGDPPTEEDIEGIVDKNFYLRYAHKDLGERIKTKALGLIKSYVKNNNFRFRNGTKTEIPFELFMNNSLLGGSIDMISFEKDKLQVIDIKTDKEIEPEKYYSQLRIYSLACKEELDIWPVDAYVYDIEKNEYYQVNIDAKSLEEARSNISEIIDKISVQESFEPKKGTHCEDCDMNLICPYTP